MDTILWLFCYVPNREVIEYSCISTVNFETKSSKYVIYRPYRLGNMNLMKKVRNYDKVLILVS